MGSELKYCKSCVQALTRPKLYVSPEGVCGACLWEEEKKKIDWQARYVALIGEAGIAKALAALRGTYDCAIGVSGGKDSTFQALYAKEELGLNCLLVNSMPESTTELGRHNMENLISRGFDCIHIRVNPLIQKKLMRRDFFKYGQIRKSSEYPLWASVYTVAKEKNIPLVIQGENSALTLGVSEGINTDWDASQIHKTNTLGGKSASEEYLDIVKAEDILLYQFPDLSDWNGKAIWLQWFLEEWSPLHNASFAFANGFNQRDDDLKDLGRIHRWTACDSDFHVVNQLLKYAKFGFGFATDESCYDIREGVFTRDTGFRLVEMYDGLCGEEFIKKFCDFIDITEDEFWDNVKKWAKYKRKEWKIK